MFLLLLPFLALAGALYVDRRRETRSVARERMGGFEEDMRDVPRAISESWQRASEATRAFPETMEEVASGARAIALHDMTGAAGEWHSHKGEILHAVVAPVSSHLSVEQVIDIGTLYPWTGMRTLPGPQEVWVDIGGIWRKLATSITFQPGRIYEISRIPGGYRWRWASWNSAQPHVAASSYETIPVVVPVLYPG